MYSAMLSSSQESVGHVSGSVTPRYSGTAESLAIRVPAPRHERRLLFAQATTGTARASRRSRNQRGHSLWLSPNRFSLNGRLFTAWTEPFLRFDRRPSATGLVNESAFRPRNGGGLVREVHPRTGSWPARPGGRAGDPPRVGRSSCPGARRPDAFIRQDARGALSSGAGRARGPRFAKDTRSND